LDPPSTRNNPLEMPPAWCVETGVLYRSSFLLCK